MFVDCVRGLWVGPFLMDGPFATCAHFLNRCWLHRGRFLEREPGGGAGRRATRFNAVRDGVRLWRARRVGLRLFPGYGGPGKMSDTLSCASGLAPVTTGRAGAGPLNGGQTTWPHVRRLGRYREDRLARPGYEFLGDVEPPGAPGHSAGSGWMRLLSDAWGIRSLTECLRAMNGLSTAPAGGLPVLCWMARVRGGEWSRPERTRILAAGFSGGTHSAHTLLAPTWVVEWGDSQRPRVGYSFPARGMVDVDFTRARLNCGRMTLARRMAGPPGA